MDDSAIPTRAGVNWSGDGSSLKMAGLESPGMYMYRRLHTYRGYCPSRGICSAMCADVVGTPNWNPSFDNPASPAKQRRVKTLTDAS